MPPCARPPPRWTRAPNPNHNPNPNLNPNPNPNSNPYPYPYPNPNPNPNPNSNPNQVDAGQLQALLDAIAEVEPLCGGGASAASDELDDAI